LVDLTDDVRRRLEEVSRIDLGFPHDFLREGFFADMLHGDVAARMQPRAGRSRV
jgi:hypothetical protein